MTRTDTLQGSLDLLVLKILPRRPRLHGYAIMAAVASTSGEALCAEKGSPILLCTGRRNQARLAPSGSRRPRGDAPEYTNLLQRAKKQLGTKESRWLAVSLAINRILREA